MEGHAHLVVDRLLQFEVPTAEALLEAGGRPRLAGLPDALLLAGLATHLLVCREMLPIALWRLLLASGLLLAGCLMGTELLGRLGHRQ